MKETTAVKKTTAKKTTTTVKKTSTNRKRTPKGTRKLTDYIVFVLDESGSMAVIREQAIELFNQQVKALGENKVDSQKYVSLYTFSTLVDKPRVDFEDVGKLPTLDYASYNPNGMTALYDAVGRAIQDVRTRPDAGDANTSVLFVIITDGEENSSKKFSTNSIAELIQDCQKTGRWTFTYLGAEGIDLSDISKKMNIPFQNTMSYAHSPAGVMRASATLDSCMDTYFQSRASGLDSVQDFYGGADKDAEDED